MHQGIKASPALGGNIRALRVAAGLTQDKLAARLQLQGCDISRGTLAKIEAGIRHVSLEELTQLRAALRAQWEELLRQG